MRTAIYCRVSTNQQSTGLEAQLLACKQFCQQQNINDFAVFSDEAISGMRTSRPSFDLMLNQVKAGEFQRVVTYSFSRIGRSTIHLISVLAELNRLGVAFISISERLDTATPIGKVVYTILSSLAEFERETLVQRVKAGLNNAKAKGKRLGAPRKAINTTLLLNLKSQGLSYVEIGKLLGCSPAKVCRELKLVSQRSPI